MSDIYVRFKEFNDNEGKIKYVFVKYDEESKYSIDILMRISNFFKKNNQEDYGDYYKKNDDGSIRFYPKDEVDIYLDINEKEKNKYIEEYTIGITKDLWSNRL